MLTRDPNFYPFQWGTLLVIFSSCMKIPLLSVYYKLWRILSIVWLPAFLLLGHCRFEELLNTSTARFYMREFSSLWVTVRLGLVNALLFAFIALIIFLLRDVVPTSYAGAVLVYALQVGDVCTVKPSFHPCVSVPYPFLRCRSAVAAVPLLRFPLIGCSFTDIRKK